MSRHKGVNPNRLCENCNMPLGNRVPSARYCLRVDCRKDIERKQGKKAREKKKKEWFK